MGFPPPPDPRWSGQPSYGAPPPSVPHPPQFMPPQPPYTPPRPYFPPYPSPRPPFGSAPPPARPAISSHLLLIAATAPNATGGIGGITAGPDGNLWFTETNASQIGRSTPSGSMQEYSVSNAAPAAICAGPDGNLWFINEASGIGSIAP